MLIKLNGEIKNFDHIHTVSDLLNKLSADDQSFAQRSPYIAVAINQSFISKSEYDHQALQEMDAIEIVSPHPGG